MMEEQRLFLDVRFERKGAGSAGRRHADLHLVGIGRSPSVTSPKPADSVMRAGCADVALAGPESGLHAALGGELARQGSGGRGLQQLQRAIEVGLADAIGADEHRQPSRRKTDRAQGTVVGGVDLADNHAPSVSTALSSREAHKSAARRDNCLGRIDETCTVCFDDGVAERPIGITLGDHLRGARLFLRIECPTSARAEDGVRAAP